MVGSVLLDRHQLVAKHDQQQRRAARSAPDLHTHQRAGKAMRNQRTRARNRVNPSPPHGPELTVPSLLPRRRSGSLDRASAFRRKEGKQPARVGVAVKVAI